MKRRRAALFLIALIFLVGLVTFLFYLRVSGYEVRRLPMDINVGDSFAFNLDTDAVHFGRVVPGNTANRNILVNNTKSVPLLVEVKAEGALEPWLSSTHVRFTLQPQTVQQVNLSVTPPAGTPHGTYTGTLVITFRRTP